VDVSDIHRLKSLEDENAKLKRLLADTMLDNVVLKDLLEKKLTTPNVRWAAARKAMRDHDISQRRACRLVGVDPKTVRRDQPSRCPAVETQFR
jgi:putative transposase